MSLTFRFYIRLPWEDNDKVAIALSLFNISITKEFKQPSFIKRKPTEHCHEYGFSYFGDSHGKGLGISYGAQTYDSLTWKSKYWSVPWTNYTFVRHSLYDTNHNWFCDVEVKGGRKYNFDEYTDAKKKVPKEYISFKDYDGELIIAECFIEEREWHLGTKWCSFLKWFSKPLIRRAIDITYNREVGTGKGSWKGGTVGCGCDMALNESIYSAFTKYGVTHKFTEMKKLNLEKVNAV